MNRQKNTCAGGQVFDPRTRFLMRQISSLKHSLLFCAFHKARSAMQGVRLKVELELKQECWALFGTELECFTSVKSCHFNHNLNLTSEKKLNICVHLQACKPGGDYNENKNHWQLLRLLNENYLNVMQGWQRSVVKGWGGISTAQSCFSWYWQLNT